jgi:hypothetical protein
MFVAVVHRIVNPATWDRKLEEFEAMDLPADMRNPISYIGADRDYAFCLWDVASIEALRPMLDELTEGAAVNTYFAVNPDAAGTAGVPAQRLDLDQRESAPTR